MADPINRLSMFSAPVGEPVNHLAQATLPPGHPSNMLMWLRDQIPAVQADDSSLTSGIASRVGRTLTGIPRAGLETMANWLEGTHNPEAVRIGPDTLAPLGAAGMARALSPITASRKPALAKKAVQQHLRGYQATYGPVTSKKHIKHLAESAGTVGLGGYSMNGLFDMDPVSAGIVGGVGVMAPHFIHTRDIYKRLKDIEARNPTPQDGAVRLADDAASAPGLAANSTQQEDDGVLSILRRYGLHD